MARLPNITFCPIILTLATVSSFPQHRSSQQHGKSAVIIGAVREKKQAVRGPEAPGEGGNPST